MTLQEELLKRDLDIGTINKLELVGDRVLVLLDNAEGHTVTASGVIIPLNDVVETDGQRLKAETSKRKHLTSGKIVRVSSTAAAKLADSNLTLSQGDVVYVSDMVGKNVASYQFFVDRSKLVQDFNGIVCIPHTLIEAKVNDNG